MSDFHFLRPYFLFLLIPFSLLSVLMLHYRLNSSKWSDICSPDLMPYVLQTQQKKFSSIPVFIFLTLSLLILAAAGPTWQMISTPLIKSQSGLVIALDLSKTMDSQDIKPSRLKRVIFKLSDLLNARLDGYTSLLVYTDEPFVVTPMTDDVSTIKAMLPALETSIMPTAGHNSYKAIAKSLDLLQQAGISNGSILLITSEISKQDMEKSIELAKQNAIKIFVLGVGTSQATPIQNADGSFIKDAKGALLISSLAKENLNFLAHSTQGAYVTVTNDDQDVAFLTKKLDRAIKNDSQSDQDLTHNKWHDQGYLLVLAALPFVALAFRRGILLLILFIFPYHVEAFSWNDLWKTPDQQAEQFFYEENFQEAQDRFTNSAWQAATHFKLQEFESATEYYQTDQTADGYYNYGTTKARQGDYEPALEAYKNGLEINPEHEDMLYNKKIIEDLLKNEEKDENDANQQDKNQDKKQSNKDNKKQNDKNQNKQDQNKQDQNNENQSDSQESNESENSENSEDNERSENSKNQDNSNDSENPQDGDNSENSDSEKNDQESNNAQNDTDNKNDSTESPDSQQNDLNDADKEAERQSQKAKEEKEQKDLDAHYRQQVDEEIDNKPHQDAVASISLDKNDQDDHQQQIDARLLDRIKDDPSALLRCKFLYQSREQK